MIKNETKNRLPEELVCSVHVPNSFKRAVKGIVSY